MVKASKKSAERKKGGAIVRPDGRRATSIYLKPEIIIALQKVAIDEGRHAYEIVEETVSTYLKKKNRL